MTDICCSVKYIDMWDGWCGLTFEYENMLFNVIIIVCVVSFELNFCSNNIIMYGKQYVF